MSEVEPRVPHLHDLIRRWNPGMYYFERNEIDSRQDFVIWFHGVYATRDRVSRDRSMRQDTVIHEGIEVELTYDQFSPDGYSFCELWEIDVSEQ